MTSLLHQINEEIAAVVERARRGLVQVHHGTGNGAGTIWHPSGLIITNAHVVAGVDYGQRIGRVARSALSVTLPDGRTLPAEVLALDADRDLAALSVMADDLPTIELGSSHPPRPGDWVLAVGHPWGVEGAVTGGIVIALGASAALQVQGAFQDWIAVSLHMRPGHSGGPLVDSEGRLVGINTMIAGPDVGFAVPLHAVKQFLKRDLAPQRS
jgi:serine protease Do